MTKTITYTITAPLESPVTPEHFTFWRFEIWDERNELYKAKGLPDARTEWVSQGHERTTLVAHCESVLLPGGGTFQIVSEWKADKGEWSPWLEDVAGKPFNFAELTRALEAEACEHGFFTCCPENFN